MRSVFFPIIRGNGKLNADNVKIVNEKLELLNQDLGRNEYLAGSNLTIADLAALATWTSIEQSGFFETSKLTNGHEWFKRIQASNRIKNWDELVVQSAKAFGDILKSKVVK